MLETSASSPAKSAVGAEVCINASCRDAEDNNGLRTSVQASWTSSYAQWMEGSKAAEFFDAASTSSPGQELESSREESNIAALFPRAYKEWLESKEVDEIFFASLASPTISSGLPRSPYVYSDGC